jgi:hypothetical protein
MADAKATLMNPWLKRRLVLRDNQLFNADCRVGDLGPILIVQSNDTLEDVERAAGVPIATNLVDGAIFPHVNFTPSWETCEGDHGWYEITYVTSDDGSGVVIFVPDRDGIDATLRAIVLKYADTH